MGDDIPFKAGSMFGDMAGGPSGVGVQTREVTACGSIIIGDGMKGGGIGQRRAGGG